MEIYLLWQKLITAEGVNILTILTSFFSHFIVVKTITEFLEQRRAQKLKLTTGVDKTKHC